MDPNIPPPTTLTEIYKSVWLDINDAAELREKLLRRTAWYQRYSVVGRWTRVDPFMPLPADMADAMVSSATPAEGQHRAFDLVTGPHWIEAIARESARRYAISPSVAEVLSELHGRREEMMRAQAARLAGKALLGTGLGVLTFVAAQVPKESFEELGWGNAYGWYRLALLALVLAVAVLALAMAAITRRGSQSLIRQSQTMNLVLTFCRYELPAAGTQSLGGPT